MFSFGYDRDAIFAAKVRRSRRRFREATHSRSGVHGDLCKNIDVPLTVVCRQSRGPRLK